MNGKSKFDTKKSEEVVDKILKSEELGKVEEPVAQTIPIEEPKKVKLDLAAVLGEHPEGHVKDELAKLVEQKAVILTPEEIAAIILQATVNDATKPTKPSKLTTALKVVGSIVAVSGAVVGGVYLYKYLAAIEQVGAVVATGEEAMNELAAEVGLSVAAA